MLVLSIRFFISFFLSINSFLPVNLIQYKISLHNRARKENIYLIKVLAENKSERIYKIIVNRLEEGIVLSNNNYLANLSIKNHSIAFVKDKLNYDITLTNEETLDLKYDLEDEKAFVKIEGNNNLKNNSVVKIIVTAEDGSTRIYNLNIINIIVGWFLFNIINYYTDDYIFYNNFYTTMKTSLSRLFHY